jgi:hypothetical protein
LVVNGGVVHGHAFESLTFVDQWWRVHGRGFESFTFLVNGGVVVHGRGFESLILGVNGGVITIRKISKANQTPCKPFEATRLPSIAEYNHLENVT